MGKYFKRDSIYRKFNGEWNEKVRKLEIRGNVLR
jgi:hypothetical protein